MKSDRRKRRARRDSDEDVIAPTDAVGGGYEPLDGGDLERIVSAAFDILAEIGLSEGSADTVELVTNAGGTLTDEGRLTFPRDLVSRCLESAPSTVTLCGQNSEHDMHLGGDRVYTGTGGAAPLMVYSDSGSYRSSTLRDLYNAARLCDTLRHVHFFSRCLVAGDMPTDRDLDLNTAFACLSGTTKHVMVSASHPDHVGPIAEICYAIAGSEEAFRTRPFLSFNINHAVPPLRLHPESCDVMIAASRAGIPAHANVFGQLGASSPVTLAGSVAQTIAEALAGIVITQLAAPGASVICGPRPMIVDLRSGAMTGGGGEQAQANAIAIQVMRHLGLAGSIIAGATDSKLPDNQAGYEKSLAVTMAVHSGANLVTQACGMQAGLMGVSLEAYVIDNDMLGAILRSAMTPVVSDETLALDAIADVVRGEGHFLGRPETYQRMKSDFLYPEIADRRTHQEWAEAGDKDLVDRARTRVREVLSTHYPDHVHPDLRQTLRETYDLKLAETEMRPA